ncbi:hypothetical protein ACWPKO_11945 [Coraliomargarita sp. W4R53]
MRGWYRLCVWRLLLQLFVLSVIFCLIVYLSLRSSSSMEEIAWLPGPIAAWADRHGDLRTFVPYGIAAVLWCWLVRVYCQLRPSIQMSSGVQMICGLLLGASVLFGLLLVTEFWQLFLPKRFASLGDVFWGSIGIVGGIAVGGRRLRK